jgi:hypothetical protein
LLELIRLDNNMKLKKKNFGKACTGQRATVLKCVVKI